VNSVRTYGQPPFRVAVLHGGPGAPGQMAPVARELSSQRGVLEPLQTADSIAGQIHELQAVLREHGSPPLTLIGSSWGAWLGVLLAASHPALVEKLILVGSGPFEAHYADSLLATRLSRLGDVERREARALLAGLLDSAAQDRDAALARLGELFGKADAYDPLPKDTDGLPVQYHIFESVWSEASALRASGQLLRRVACVRCPVLAIHGDSDPHPAEGVWEPLSRVLDDFRFVLLERCGHLPWMERQAREAFYALLRQEIRWGGLAGHGPAQNIREQTETAANSLVPSRSPDRQQLGA
jgi:pimeloyl-ACP methyl ester carboxylesterase